MQATAVIQRAWGAGSPGRSGRSGQTVMKAPRTSSLRPAMERLASNGSPQPRRFSGVRPGSVDRGAGRSSQQFYQPLRMPIQNIPPIS